MAVKWWIGIITLALMPQAASAHGFKLRLEGNKIVAENDSGFAEDNLFAHAFAAQDALGTFESSHGSVDANDAGSGFFFPPSLSSDTFSYHIHHLWVYDAGVPELAGAGVTLDLLRLSDGAPRSHIDGQTAIPTSFEITATTAHELIWSVPQSSPDTVFGLVYSIRGVSGATGLPFIESDPVVVVQWTPNFSGDTNAATQAIYLAATAIAAVPEPASCVVFGIGAVVLGAGLWRKRRSK